MKFENAYNGVKKLFISEIISIVSSLLAIIMPILYMAANKSNDEILIRINTVLGFGGSVLLLAAFVFQIFGLNEAGKANVKIKYAFYCIIFAIILTSVNAGLNSIVNKDYFLDTVIRIFNIGIDVLTVFVAYYVLSGISTLANKLGNEKMAKRGIFLSKVILILFVISILFNLFPTFIETDAPREIKLVGQVVASLSSLVELAAYILIVIYYYQAMKMFKNAKDQDKDIKIPDITSYGVLDENDESISE